MEESTTPNMIPEKSGSTGSIVAAIVILAIIIVGALYFWGHRAAVSSDESLDAIGTQSNSDDTASIEADLNATDVNNVDSGLDESEFNAS